MSQFHFMVYLRHRQELPSVHALFWTLLNAELLSKVTQKDLRHICMLIDQLIATWIHESDVLKEQEFKKENQSARTAHRKITADLSWD